METFAELAKLAAYVKQRQKACFNIIFFLTSNLRKDCNLLWKSHKCYCHQMYNKELHALMFV